MRKTISSSGNSRDGRRAKPKVSKLGRELRKIAEKIAASGEKPLTRREIAREVAERRGARY